MLVNVVVSPLPDIMKNQETPEKLSGPSVFGLKHEIT